MSDQENPGSSPDQSEIIRAVPTYPQDPGRVGGMARALHNHTPQTTPSSPPQREALAGVATKFLTYGNNEQVIPVTLDGPVSTIFEATSIHAFSGEFNIDMAGVPMSVVCVGPDAEADLIGRTSGHAKPMERQMDRFMLAIGDSRIIIGPIDPMNFATSPEPSIEGLNTIEDADYDIAHNALRKLGTPLAAQAAQQLKEKQGNDSAARALAEQDAKEWLEEAKRVAQANPTRVKIGRSEGVDPMGGSKKIEGILVEFIEPFGFGDDGVKIITPEGPTTRVSHPLSQERSYFVPIPDGASTVSRDELILELAYGTNQVTVYSGNGRDKEPTNPLTVTRSEPSGLPRDLS